MNITTITAPDIVCDGCANAIKKALSTLEGVTGVSVDVNAKTVSVTHEPTVQRETITGKLDRAGFPVAE